MLRILFGIITFVLALVPWGLLMFFGGFGGANSEQTQEIDRLNQELLISRQAVEDKDTEITQLEEDILADRSKLEFLEEGIAKAEGARDDAVSDTKLLNGQIKKLRGELTDAENRLLEETNRANTLESMNEDIAAQLDKSIQETRRMQNIIRTLSKTGG